MCEYSLCVCLWGAKLWNIYPHWKRKFALDFWLYIIFFIRLGPRLGRQFNDQQAFGCRAMGSIFQVELLAAAASWCTFSNRQIWILEIDQKFLQSFQWSMVSEVIKMSLDDLPEEILLRIGESLLPNNKDFVFFTQTNQRTWKIFSRANSVWRKRLDQEDLVKLVIIF